MSRTDVVILPLLMLAGCHGSELSAPESGQPGTTTNSDRANGPRPAARKHDPRRVRHVIGGAVIELVELEMFQTEQFSQISDYFANTTLTDKLGYMYAGTDTAAVPVLDKEFTVYWVCADKVPRALEFVPEGATLRAGSVEEIASIKDITVYASCPPWEFLAWREQHGQIRGFLLFPRVNGADRSVTLPYLQDKKRAVLVFRFHKE